MNKKAPAAVVFASVVMFLATIVSPMPAKAASTWTIQSVDAKAMLDGISLALDSNENLHVCYLDSENGVYNYPSPWYVMYASQTGSNWNIQTITPEGISANLGAVGYGSLALDSNNTPYIVYSAAGNLTYASWNGDNWRIQTVDSTSSGSWGGSQASLALDSEGKPHIAYSGTNGALKYASWNGTRWLIQTIESGAGVPIAGIIQHLTFDSDSHPCIVYAIGTIGSTQTNWTVKWAMGTDSSLGNWSIQTVSNAKPYSTGLALGNVAMDSSGNPHFAFVSANGSVTYNSWNDTSWNAQSVDTVDLPAECFIKLDANDNPHIVYSKIQNDTFDVSVMYAEWTGQAWDTQTVYRGYIIAGSNPMPLTLDSKNNPHLCFLTVRHTPTRYIHDGTLMYATSNESVTTPTPTPTPSPSLSIPEFPPSLAVVLVLAASAAAAACGRRFRRAAIST